MSAAAPAGTRMDTGEDIAAFDTIRRGIRFSPELTEGFALTLVLAVLAALRRPGAADDHATGPDTTLVVVAYRKATISLADEVVFLADGRVADRGTHAELLARNPAYAHLVNAYEQEHAEAATEEPSTEQVTPATPEEARP